MIKLAKQQKNVRYTVFSFSKKCDFSVAFFNLLTLYFRESLPVTCIRTKPGPEWKNTIGASYASGHLRLLESKKDSFEWSDHVSVQLPGQFHHYLNKKWLRFNHFDGPCSNLITLFVIIIGTQKRSSRFVYECWITY